jgi:AraC-like DNA-binding protein
MDSKHYVRSAVLAGLPALVVDRELLSSTLTSARLGIGVVSDLEEFVPSRSVGMLLENVATILGRPSLGLDWAAQVGTHFPNLGPAALMAQFHDTAGAWLRFLRGYWSVHTNAHQFEVFEDFVGGRVVLRIKAGSAMAQSRQYSEFMIAILHRLVSHVVADDLKPLWVSFDHSAPRDRSFHEAAFGCTLRFEENGLAIAYDISVLKMRLLRNEADVQSWMRRSIQTRLALEPFYDVSLSSNVEMAVRSLLGAGRSDAHFVAQCLGVGSKTLQRQLAMEDASYSQILERVRALLAGRLLEASNSPVSNIATLLGYSTTAPFTMAFRRWHNVSPLQYRKERRDDLCA